MLPAAASLLLAVSCGDLPTRTASTPAQRNPMRASAPPLCSRYPPCRAMFHPPPTFSVPFVHLAFRVLHPALFSLYSFLVTYLGLPSLFFILFSLSSASPQQPGQGSAGLRSSSSAIMDESVQPQHPYLSSSSFSPTASPYTIATLSSQPGSPSSSSPSSGSSSRVSSPSTTPPSSLPHSPRSSFSGSMFVSSPATTTRPVASTSSSFPTLPIMQSDSAVNLSGSHPSLPHYAASHFYSPPLSSAGGGLQPPEPPGFEMGVMMERPSNVGSGGAIPVSRSADDFSAFSSSAFPYSLWSYPTSSTSSPSSASSPAAPHHQPLHQPHPHHYPQQQHSYSADGLLAISQQSPLSTQPHHQQLSQPLSLSTSGVYVPSHHQYRPTASMTQSSRPQARHFSWEGPIVDKPVARPVGLEGHASAPSAAAHVSPVPRRASADGGDRQGIDEQIVGRLKKIRDSPGSPKAKVARLIHAYEDYLKTHESTAATHGDGGSGGGPPKRRSGSGRGAAVAAPSVGATRKTKLYCRTLIFGAKVARLSEKCDEDAEQEGAGQVGGAHEDRSARHARRRDGRQTLCR